MTLLKSALFLALVSSSPVSAQAGATTGTPPLGGPSSATTTGAPRGGGVMVEPRGSAAGTTGASGSAVTVEPRGVGSAAGSGASGASPAVILDSTAQVGVAAVQQWTSQTGIVLTEEARERVIRTPIPTATVSIQSFGPSLGSLPVITIVVQPSPPRDYAVEINGKPVRVTEQGRYGLPPGPNAVLVSRSGKSPCSWRGVLAEGTQTTVNCNL
jgi:hypothetical protein